MRRRVRSGRSPSVRRTRTRPGSFPTTSSGRWITRGAWCRRGPTIRSASIASACRRASTRSTARTSPWSIGRLTTHGCIRLYPEDIEDAVSAGRGRHARRARVRAGQDRRATAQDLRRDPRRRVPTRAATSSATRGARSKKAGVGARVDPSACGRAVRAKRGIPVDVTARPRRDAAADRARASRSEPAIRRAPCCSGATCPRAPTDARRRWRRCRRAASLAVPRAARRLVGAPPRPRPSGALRISHPTDRRARCPCGSRSAPGRACRGCRASPSAACDACRRSSGVMPSAMPIWRLVWPSATSWRICRSRSESEIVSSSRVVRAR